MQIIRSGMKALTCGAVLGALVLLGGCESKAEQQAKHEQALAKKQEKESHDEMLKQSEKWWPSEMEHQSSKDFANAQAAAGAQDDASLSSEHFTGGKLNTLGEAKLKMMMEGGVQPAVVYLGTVDEATANVRRAAIDSFLKESGAGTDALVVKNGFNPRMSTPAEYNIKRLPRTESTGAGNVGGGSMSTGAGTSSGGSQ